MDKWVAIPTDSCFFLTESIVFGLEESFDIVRASYAINLGLSTSLNGEVVASFEIQDWKCSEAAGLICRADTSWSFFAFYIWADEPNSGMKSVVLASYKEGYLTRLAVSEQKLILDNSKVQMKLRYHSGKLQGIVVSGQKKFIVEAISSINPFPGFVGIIRFNHAQAIVTDFEWKPIIKKDTPMNEELDYKWDVFISHATPDKEKIRKIVSKLRSEDLRVWVDEEQIKFGDGVVNKIQEGLNYSRRLIVCLSQSLGKSNWCRNEYEALINTEITLHGTKVIPLVIENVEYDNIPPLLRDKRRAEYSSSLDWSKLIEQLRS